MTGIRRPGLVCEEAISSRISRIRFLQVSHLSWLQCRTLHPNSHCERSGGTAAIKGPVHTLLNHLNIFAILSPCFPSGHRSAHSIVCHRPCGSSSIEELAGYCFFASTLTILWSNFLAYCPSAQFIDDHGTRPTRAHTSLLYVADRGIYVTTRVAVRSSFLSPNSPPSGGSPALIIAELGNSRSQVCLRRTRRAAIAACVTVRGRVATDASLKSSHRLESSLFQSFTMTS